MAAAGATLVSRMLVSTRATPWFSLKSWILLTLLNSDSTVVRFVFKSMTWLMPWRGPTRRVVAGCFSSCAGRDASQRQKGRGRPWGQAGGPSLRSSPPLHASITVPVPQC